MEHTSSKYILDIRRFKMTLLIVLTIITLMLVGVGFLGYFIGYTNTTVECNITLENTVKAVSDSLADYYEDELEKEQKKVKVVEMWVNDLQETVDQLQSQLSSAVGLEHILLTYPMETFQVTAYTEDNCDKLPSHPAYGITSSGEYVKEWYTIAAPKNIPFGTVIYIPFFKDMPNKGIFVVKDRGGAIKEGRLDVYMKDIQDAINFGRRDLEVYILK